MAVRTIFLIRHGTTRSNVDKIYAGRNDEGLIEEGIEQAERQVEHFSMTHENVIAALASIYSEQISPLSPRIMVEGSDGHLSNPTNAAKIRALLLAGIRAAILWRQCGGSRLQLLFKRRSYLDSAAALLR